MNKMQAIYVDKVTVNFGAGREPGKLEKGIKLLTMITGQEPVKTITQERIPGWGLRPGLPIGAMLTLRGSAATDLLKRLLDAKEFTLKPSSFDNSGNVSFGLKEYIDIPGAKYDPDIGIMGFQVSVTLARPGFRVQRRKVRTEKIGKSHKISGEQALAFMQKEFGVKLESDDE